MNALKRHLFILKEKLFFAGMACILLFYILQHRLWDLTDPWKTGKAED